MAIDIGSIFEKIHALEAELDAELARRAAELRFGFEHGKLVFEQEVLRYLNLIEKINCAFCSYANGLIAYAREIASLTEAFWCPIKHAKRLQGVHSRYKDFADFGDAAAHTRHVEAFYKKLDK